MCEWIDSLVGISVAVLISLWVIRGIPLLVDIHVSIMFQFRTSPLCTIGLQHWLPGQHGSSHRRVANPEHRVPTSQVSEFTRFINRVAIGKKVLCSYPCDVLNRYPCFPYSWILGVFLDGSFLDGIRRDRWLKGAQGTQAQLR